MCLLVHGIGELHTGQFLLQEVFHICGVGAGYVSGCYDAGLYGGVLKKLRCACACHHHGVEVEIPTNRVCARSTLCLRHDAAQRAHEHEGEYLSLHVVWSMDAVKPHINKDTCS